MAWLEKRGRRFLLVFRLKGSRYKKLLVPTDEREAEAIAAKVERRIGMLERGEWQLPVVTQGIPIGLVDVASQAEPLSPLPAPHADKLLPLGVVTRPRNPA